MNEKIDLLTKGVFLFEKPSLIANIDNPVITIESGKIYRGYITVSTSTGEPVRGFVFSSSGLISFDDHYFAGTDNRIDFSLDATYLDRDDQNIDRNDRLKGRISVVSEFGEAFIPFRAVIRPSVCETGIGPASDLFHFASLAQTDWTEAENLFMSDIFRRTFTASDPRLDTVYRVLRKSKDRSSALEELLVASHKKKPVGITTDKDSFTIDYKGEETECIIILRRDTWGCTEIGVSASPEFIVLSSDRVTDSMFTGGICEYRFRIDPAGLHGGTNYGTITFETGCTRTTVSVTVRNPIAGLKDMLLRRKQLHYVNGLNLCLLDYKLGRLTPMKYASETIELLDGLKTLREETPEDRLLRVYAMTISGRTTQASVLLSVVEEDGEWDDDPRGYAIMVALRAMIDNDPRRMSETVQRLRDLFEREGDPMIFALATELDRRRRISSSARYDTYRRNYGGGSVCWPVLYEAVLAINEEPTALKELSAFDLQVVNFGLRHDMIGRNAVLQAAFIAGRAHTTSGLTIRVLTRAFERFKLNEVLEPLCRHLIMSDCCGREAYKWLSVGVNEQLMVKDISEHCLKAAGDALDEPLPKSLLPYFTEMSGLSEEMETALYANAVLFGQASDALGYRPMAQMRNFVWRMLASGRFSKGLAILYDKVLQPSDIHGTMLINLPGIIFKHLVRVGDKVTGIIVAHKELEKEEYYPVTDGEAFVDIFTEEAGIFTVDGSGARHVADDIVPERLISNEAVIRLAEEKCPDDDRVALHSLESARYRGSGDDTIGLVRRCAEISGLEKRFALSCYRELIEYYYDNDEGDLMESYLVRVDLSELDRSSRARMIDLMILRDLYTLAMDNLVRFGITGVDVKRLSKLASVLIREESVQVGSAGFLDMCELVFRKKRHTPEILEFLVNHYQGDTESMYEIWLAARESKIETLTIEEKLITALLFTESDMSYACDVFKHYYSRGIHNNLTNAFLSYYAYGFVAYDRLPEEEMLEIILKESVYESSDVCTLAALKYLSGKGKYTSDEKEFIEERIGRMERKGVIFPFFKEFGDDIKAPACMRDKCYVEYHTDPRRHVLIHYCLPGVTPQGTYTVEEMKDVGFGIFVKDFVLFYDEKLQYYISEETEKGSTITEASELTHGPELGSSDDSRYHQLNLMITAREMNDIKTMHKMMESYIRTDHLCHKLFRPIS